ncbi:FIG00450913: hypothetical protein [Olavius algarvensis associated proteobacterium Delta 3]|nr:FIG00450913: hypothetical protein [Olavius algarvensis associated proteobacterium Delta 3]
MSITWRIIRSTEPGCHTRKPASARAGLLVLFALFLAPVSIDAGQTIYQWKDDQGIRHFSDVPASDTPAETVDHESRELRSDSPEDDSEPPSKAVSRRQGILWSITRGRGEPNYLLGTIPSGDDRVMAFPTPVRNALQHARSFTMEMIPDAAALMKLSSAMLLQDGQDLRSILGDALYSEVVSGMAEQGFSEPVVLRLKPWVVLSMLSTPRPKSASFMDLKLYHSAIAKGKPVFGLETPEEQIAVFDDISVSDQIHLIRQILDQRPNITEMTEQILQIYLNRDLDAMLGFAESYLTGADTGVTDRFMKRLNNERNHRMTDRLISRLQEGGAFVAVGALHLPGPEGLLKLLEDKGFEVSPLY